MSPTFKYKRVDRRIFPDEFAAIMKNLRYKYLDEARAITILLYYSGARISEVLSVKPHHIRESNPAEIEVTIISLKREKRYKMCPVCHKKRVAKNYARKNTPKTKFKCMHCGEYFDIPLIKEKKIEPETRTLTFRKDLPFFDVFLAWWDARRGKEFMWAISRDMYHYILKRTNPNVSAHAFRHSVGRILNEQGVGIADIKEVLGHKKLDTTIRYITGSKEQTKQIKKMGEWVVANKSA